ncbi:hypothetical protein OKA04_05405 [Luteolibacter flavescens]|uniref:Uncharacterized protein n=1 Tax=Luteolibacter flavescens TaxID=1859460 RepID=A0ABT3FKR6_9BACT|nr:hypothetical protein [Luteolibacter flavescens]MCW1884157.1 hypothetical protein [Luteolibacter flavescens]
MNIHSLTLAAGAFALLLSASMAVTNPRSELFQTFIIASSILLGAGVISSSKEQR